MSPRFVNFLPETILGIFGITVVLTIIGRTLEPYVLANTDITKNSIIMNWGEAELVVVVLILVLIYLLLSWLLERERRTFYDEIT